MGEIYKRGVVDKRSFGRFRTLEERTTRIKANALAVCLPSADQENSKGQQVGTDVDGLNKRRHCLEITVKPGEPVKISIPPHLVDRAKQRLEFYWAE